MCSKSTKNQHIFAIARTIFYRRKVRYICLFFLIHFQHLIGFPYAQAANLTDRDPVTAISAALDFISTTHQLGYLPLIRNGEALPVLYDQDEFAGVRRAIKNLLEDFARVTGNIQSQQTPGSSKIIIGTYGHSRLIDSLIKSGLIESNELAGKREKFIIKTTSNSKAATPGDLIIVGSDKRGTMYGIYELSKQIGVSPWYYWADIPVKKASNLYVKPGSYTDGEPMVKYRGIFLNDEAPALSGWSKATFGGFNAAFYEKVFELLLRLRANYLWPAMWGSAFYDDDARNGALADEMGIVMGTSHHEPLARAHAEWKRYGRNGEWDYVKNKKGLLDFWRKGLERSKSWESILTIGMRGDGDEPMHEDENVALLERIVKDQRDLIKAVTNKPVDQSPQLWALYKEVQDYYDKGMRVPDDVTLLFCDDNWGNVRRLPALDAKPRKGGYGMYYHFDYVGGPRNSKWINVSQIQRIWEQMNLTYHHGVDEIWIVNVGDLKPMEFPISFFLDMAWNPNRFHAANLYNYTEEWCIQQFGARYGKQAAGLLHRYTKFNHRVTPELLDHNTFSLTHYAEFERVVKEYHTLNMEALQVYYLLTDTLKDAFDQLILFPIHACANLYEMYYAKAMNDRCIEKGDPQANFWADQVKICFERDSLLTMHYHQDIAGGKWPHMMDQVRIGYSSWNNPSRAVMPTVRYLPEQPIDKRAQVFVEESGYIAMEAANYASAHADQDVHWIEIPDLGKTASAMTTMPVTAQIGAETFLTYTIEVKDTVDATIWLLTSPTLNFNDNKGLRYAVAVDDGEEVIINFNGHYQGELGQWQAERIIKSSSVHKLTPGEHELKIRFLDQGIVLQRLIVDLGGLKDSYLGPPESPVLNR